MAADALAATLPQEGRSTNEDAFLVRPGPPLVVALADGAGNAEQAARRVLRGLERMVAATTSDELRSFATWAGWFRGLDAALAGGAESTLVAVAVLEDRVLGACAGDSRAYLWDSEGELRILAETAGAGSKARLGSGRVEPVPIHARFARGEVLILASDGAWTPLPLPRLRDTIARVALGRFAELPEAILREASRSGRGDDMTVVCVRQR